MSDVVQTTGRAPELFVRCLRRIKVLAGRAVTAIPALAVRRLSRVERGKIAFMTNSLTYSCNPRYIYEELKRRDPSRKMVWIAGAGARDWPPDAAVVRLGSLACLKAVYSSEIWIDNGIAFSEHFERRPDQYHIQTMHGSLGIKRIDNAVTSRMKRGRSGREVVRRETELTDFVITNSAFEEGVFRRVFWKDVPMLRLGHARTDPLFGRGGRSAEDIRADVVRRYGIAPSRRLAIFAPTHRKDLSAADLDFGFERMAGALSRKFGGEWTLLVRLHRWTRGVKMRTAGGSVVDATDYPDMQELIVVAEAGITDFSSWIFDYVVTGRPGFIFASGAERYAAATGLCYPLEESPFPVAYDAETLFANVAAFDEAAYTGRVKEFLDRMECVDDGRSAERVADWLVKLPAKEGA